MFYLAPSVPCTYFDLNYCFRRGMTRDMKTIFNSFLINYNFHINIGWMVPLTGCEVHI